VGWFHVLTGLVVGILFYRSGANILLLLAAIVCTVGTLWTFGIMHNYAVEAAKQRSDYKGEFSNFTKREVDAIPNRLAFLNFLFSAASFIFMIVAIVMSL
jgi:hypothetical protein